MKLPHADFLKLLSFLNNKEDNKYTVTHHYFDISYGVGEIFFKYENHEFQLFTDYWIRLIFLNNKGINCNQLAVKAKLDDKTLNFITQAIENHSLFVR